MTNYNCPGCDLKIEKGDLNNLPKGKKKCPQCGKILKFERVQAGNKFRYHLIADDSQPEQAPGLSTVVAQLPPRVGTRLTKDGEIPEIFLMDKGDEAIPPRYRVVYTGIIVRDWVYCPACDGKMFQNMYIDTGMGEAGQEHKCQHCKAMVEFVFHSVGVLQVRS